MRKIELTNHARVLIPCPGNVVWAGLCADSEGPWIGEKVGTRERE